MRSKETTRGNKAPATMTAAWRNGQKVWLQDNSATLLRAALTSNLFKITEDGLKALKLEEAEVRRRSDV